jgi:glycosyltransferase involved in cell wall biosynthesis
MHVLMVHNYYRQRGGEDQVFENEAKLLEQHGINVIRYTVSNNEFEKYPPLRAFTSCIWNPETYRNISELITRHPVDVIHCHNLWAVASPSVYWAGRKKNIPIVQTLHNYRMVCCNGLLLREGRICTECYRRHFVPTLKPIKYKCYRNSRSTTLAIYSMINIHRVLGTWKKKVNLYIAPSNFQKKILSEAGLPESKIAVKHNFTFELPTSMAKAGNHDYVVYIGRLSPEKGIDVLLKAWEAIPHIPLVIAGNGPLAERVKEVSKKCLSIKYTGQISHENVISIIAGARCVIVPSICFESMPLITLEAFSCGTPVVASRVGALPEIIEDNVTGLLFTPGNINEMISKIQSLWHNQDLAIQMGKQARAEYERKYSEKVAFNNLMSIYEQAINASRKGRDR